MPSRLTGVVDCPLSVPPCVVACTIKQISISLSMYNPLQSMLFQLLISRSVVTETCTLNTLHKIHFKALQWFVIGLLFISKGKKYL